MTIFFLERSFWTREAFFVEALAGWLLLSYSCIIDVQWYLIPYICGGFVLLVAEWMIAENE